MISTYPNFTKLDINIRHDIRKITEKFEPYSDFNFSSLFSWNVDGSTEVAMLNGNLVVRMPDYLDGHLTYSLLGTSKIDESLKLLLELEGTINLLPQVVIDAIQNTDDFVIVEDIDNNDYIYENAKLARFAGKHYKKKGNKANNFTRAHENIQLEILTRTTLSPDHIQKLRHLDLEWAKKASRDDGDILPERQALRIMLENFSHLNAILVEVWVAGEIKAFSINELLPGQFAICHFEKALHVHHEHINTYLVKEVAKVLEKNNCNYVNWEQDLGLDGLRRSKSSYHPVKMLKKYTVKLAHEL